MSNNENRVKIAIDNNGRHFRIFRKCKGHNLLDFGTSSYLLYYYYYYYFIIELKCFLRLIINFSLKKH